MAPTFKSILLDYDSSGMIQYRGVHPQAGVNYENNGWYIQKYVYNSSGNLERIEGPLRGRWSNKEALGWR